MTPEQLEQIRPRLTRFAATMLGKLNGYDQPAKGELYTRGLLTNGHRKSMQPMAERLGVDHQRLQRFITERRHRLPMRGPPVLGHPGQTSQLPDRR